LGNDELLGTLKAFQREGKIRTFGLSPRSPQDALQAVNQYPFDAIEVNFNLIDQRALEIGLFERANEGRTGVIVRTPLVFGFLSGRLTGNEEFPVIDHRANWPRVQLQRWAQAPERFAFLFQGRTPVQAALRFCLEFGEVSTVIPGMMNCREVEEDLQASQIAPLSAEEMNRIQSIYQTHEFYDKNSKKVSDDDAG
jgi:aryl-alcohol dehydrogenase-like predicted oxidoreductase